MLNNTINSLLYQQNDLLLHRITKGNTPNERPMYYYALHNRQMVVRCGGLPLSADDIDRIAEQCTVTDRFSEEANAIEAIGLQADAQLPEDYKWVTLRSRFADADQQQWHGLARAKALLEWRSNTRHCGRCGAKLNDHTSLTARICPDCGNLIFPRIEPCIIVLVHRGDEILLARHVQRNQDIYACIAGFMEAGETAEQAVVREIMEETGISVKNVRYFGSQSWPFPAQLMLAFTADYESGELKLQEDEIADAAWFHRDNCPASPQPGSIAYRLIHES